MKVLFLRGTVDKRTQTVARLEDSHDMWTHLAAGLGDEVKILYQGGHRKVYYSDAVCEEWIHSFKGYVPFFKPDVVFARGGFPEYTPVLKEHPNAFKVYYGAGCRTMPNDGISYDLVLVDSEKDLKKGTERGLPVMLWQKPAAPHFYPRDVEKQWDVCYIANKQQSLIKRIPWVYRTVPHSLSMLHLGYIDKRVVPENVTRKRVDRMEMPDWISRCRVGVAPYKAYDSAPRAVSEMIACGLPVVVTPDVRCNYPAFRCSKQNFWTFVEWVVERERTSIRKI